MKDPFGIETADFGRPCRAGPGWGPGWGPTQGFIEAPDFAKPTSRLAFWRHLPQDEWRHSVATVAWAILCTPFGRKVASLLASDGGLDYRWGLGGLRSLAADGGRKPTSFLCADGADALQLQGIGQPWP